MSADEWMDEKGVDALSASEEEMAHHVTDPPTEEMASVANETAGRSLMWTVEEELIVSTTAPPGRSRSILSRGAFLAAFVSLCVGMLRMFWPIVATALNSKHMLPMTHKSHYC